MNKGKISIHPIIHTGETPCEWRKILGWRQAARERKAEGRYSAE
jgi:hypothetical protein